MKSARLAAKALADLHGKPLLMRLVERVGEAIPRERIVLCTSTHPEDDVIEAFARDHAINSFRGNELDVMQRFLDAAAAYGAGTVARVTGDNPLTDPEMLREMFDRHASAGAEYSFTDDLPVGTRAEIIDVAALQRIHGQLVAPSFSEYMTYMLKRPDKLRQLEVPAPRRVLKRPEISLTVDTPRDLALVREIYAAFDTALPPLDDIIRWLDSAPGRVITTAAAPAAPPAAIVCSYQGDSDLTSTRD